jgi:di/tricarboxylate transporter
MSADALFVLIVIAISAVLFASNRVRLDIVAILVVLSLMLSGVLTPEAALAGFGNTVVLLVAGLLVVGEALDRTGVAQSIGNLIVRVGGNSETRLLVLLMVAAAMLSSVMSSTAVVAIFIPIVFKISAKTHISTARLLMPMSLAAMISGMLTLIATPPNLVVSNALQSFNLEPLGFFSFLPIGVVVLALAIGYMLLFGRHMLGDKNDDVVRNAGRTVAELSEAFQLSARVQRLYVSARSPLVGKTIGEVALKSRYGVRVMSIEYQAPLGQPHKISMADSDDRLDADCLLLVVGPPEAIARICETETLTVLLDTEHDRRRWLHEVGLGVVLIHPESEWIGKSLKDSGFRSRYGVHVLGVQRGKKSLGDYLDQPLDVADLLLVAGSWNRISRLNNRKHDFVVLEMPVEYADARPAHQKAPIAIAILAAMVLATVLNIVPVVTAVLMAALATIVTRCLTMEDAYRAIPWSTIVLLAGMLPVADALNQTGGTEYLVSGLVNSVGSAGPYAMMTLLFVLTCGLSLFLSNTATAVLIAPVAIQAAEALDVSPYPFAIVVLIAASSAFASPVASPVVALVVEPGRYRFVDFVKVGGPLILLAFLVTMLVTPLLFPF